MIQQLLNMNNGKKFDVVLMNPPYAQNLHLKFLEKTIEIADNVVSIQPDVWLNKSKVHTKFGKYRKIFNGYIKDIEQIDHRTTNDLFGTGNSIQSTGIFVLNSNNNEKPINLENYGFSSGLESNVFEKVNIYKNDNVLTLNKSIKYASKFSDITEKYFVPIYSWHGGKNCYDAVIMPLERAKNKMSIYLTFNSENEIINFKNSLKTNFMDWYYKNIVEPGENKIKVTMFRLKDYNKPITNETFYKIFNLNTEEIKFIENIYDNRRNSRFK